MHIMYDHEPSNVLLGRLPDIPLLLSDCSSMELLEEAYSRDPPPGLEPQTLKPILESAKF